MEVKSTQDLVFFLEDHVFKNNFSKYNRSFRDEEAFAGFYKFISENYADCLYTGKAYRVILLQTESQLNVKDIGNSFSYSFNGLRKFIKNAKQDGMTFKKVALIEANIEGIDIYMLLKDLESEGKLDRHHYIDEDEILALSSEIELVEIFTEKEFYILPNRY